MTEASRKAELKKAIAAVRKLLKNGEFVYLEKGIK